MAQKTWNVELDGKTHSVQLNWTYFGGAREVVVDGAVVNEDRKLLRWESDQHFEIDGHDCHIVTQPQAKNVAAFDVDLFVGNTLINAEHDER